MYRIALHVGNIDLEDADIHRRISKVDSLCDIGWESTDGRTLATIYYDGDSPIEHVVDVARCISHCLPEAEIDGIDQDLVSLADIAHRVGVTPQAVTYWSKGQRGPGGFPDPVGSVGGGQRGSTRVWSWPAVNSWLELHFQLGDGDEYLSPEQFAVANAEILQVHDLVAPEWKAFIQFGLEVSVVPQADSPMNSNEESPCFQTSRAFEDHSEAFQQGVKIKVGEPDVRAA